MPRHFILVISLFALVMTAGAAGTREEQAQRAAESWLALVDSGSYAQSWEAAASAFKTAISGDQWKQALDSARTPLGKVGARKLISAQYKRELPGAPDGDYVVIQFDTSYENKKAAVETVTLMLEKDGGWKVAGYFIR